MSEAPRRDERADEPSRSVGDVSAGKDVVIGDQLQAGRDIAGRDIQYIDDRRVVHVGFSEKAVVRLVVVVGGLVAVTAAVFFILGAIIASSALAALARPPNNAAGDPTVSTPQAAERFEAGLQAVRNGWTDTLTFSEDELSSWIRFIAGPAYGLHDGRARFLDPAAGTVALEGQLESLGNANVMATVAIQERSQQMFEVQSVAVQVLPTGTAFGWVPAPGSLLQPVLSDAGSQAGVDAFVRQLDTSDAWQWSIEFGP